MQPCIPVITKINESTVNAALVKANSTDALLEFSFFIWAFVSQDKFFNARSGTLLNVPVTISSDAEKHHRPSGNESEENKLFEDITYDYSRRENLSLK